ncbi:fimbria/pilus outer membrane usher protein [Oleiagrimonas sp. C23AA]|uniref:fimbria/pilus outer membrane usher protein n=1 Tax=Oleiagrimonas sp. C23AA TaxID=2719047 RepID=UPI0014223052|nr:fimbria/pilus outer membrane usher protein [Oleiagrimonas sp. C23AA]NII09427.1 fimbrial biogenesis outer membrane usher protein [Oleiagrimonas sp. C23AA]
MHMGSALLFLLVMNASSHVNSVSSVNKPALRRRLANRDLLLEVWVNGSNRHLVARVKQRSDSLYVSHNFLKRVHLRPYTSDPDLPEVAFDALRGLTARVDEARQRLMIQAVDARLYPAVFDLASSKDEPVPTSSRGLALDYDAVATHGAGGAGDGGGVTFSGTYFTPGWRLLASGFTLDTGQRHQRVRLDTSIIIERPARLRRLVLGDTVSGAVRWSRSVRLAGVQLASDYSLQPSLRTFPLPQFSGGSTVPTDLDVYIGSSRILHEHNLAAGPFQIRDLPVLTGPGEATVVTRDVLGRETSETVPFFTSSRLLKTGLKSYSLDAGWLRRGYGVDSFNYAAPALLASWRQGLSSQLTLGAHGEWSGPVSLAGGGIAFAVQPFGVVEISTAASHAYDLWGGLASVALNSQMGALSVYASGEYTSPGYRDVGSLYGPAPARFRAQAGAGVPLGEAADVALSWVATNEDGVRTRLWTASYRYHLRAGAYLAFTALYDAGSHDAQGQVYFSLPLGEHRSAGFSLGIHQHQRTWRAEYNHLPDPDGGFGYRLAGGDDLGHYARARLDWVGSDGHAWAEMAQDGRRTAERLSGAGSLIWMNGDIFTTRTTGGAFALVRTGKPHIKVQRDHRVVATSDAEGNAVVTGLSPYVTNQLSVDPTDYPMDVVLDHPRQQVVPRRHSGIVVDLGPSSGRPLLMAVALRDGTYPPAGAAVTFRGRKSRTVLGHHGMIYLSHSRPHLRGWVVWQGEACQFSVDLPAVPLNGHMQRLGPVLCTRVGRHGAR